MTNIINEEIITDENGVQWKHTTISTGKQTAIIKTRIPTEEEMNQPQPPTDIEILQERLNSQDAAITEILESILPEILGMLG